MPRHLVWDWNGTLLDDMAAVVAATNDAITAVGGSPVGIDEHRTRFRRPIIEYYAELLGRPLSDAEFAELDRAFHASYDRRVVDCALAADATAAMDAWLGTQSLLSMWFHDELLGLVGRHGLAGRFTRVDGLRERVGGGAKLPFLRAHLAELGRSGESCVLIGDSVDDGLAARAVGADAVLYSGGFTDPAALRGLGFPVVDTLAEAVVVAGQHNGSRLAGDEASR